MSKKALILHGWWGKSDENWLPWLEVELSSQNYDVYIPSLSNPDYPILTEQLEDVSDIELKSGDMIVGHSLWCQLAMQIVEQRKLEWIKIILVAPTYNNLTDELWEKMLGDSYQTLFDYTNAINNFWQLNKLENSYTIFLSDDDPYINSFTAKEYYKPLDNLEIVEFSWKWHFNTAAGISNLPEILKYLK